VVGIIFFTFLTPVFSVLLAWQLLGKRPFPLHLGVGILFGIAPISLFAWSIYRNEGGGSDSDPLLFLIITVGLATLSCLLAGFWFSFLESRS